METLYNFKLIEGQFTSIEARSVLFSLINSKINFHVMQSFSIRERNSGDTSFHDKRIKQLTETNINIRKVLDYAEKNKIDLHMAANIEIKL